MLSALKHEYTTGDIDAMVMKKHGEKKECVECGKRVNEKKLKKGGCWILTLSVIRLVSLSLSLFLLHSLSLSLSLSDSLPFFVHLFLSHSLSPISFSISLSRSHSLSISLCLHSFSLIIKLFLNGLFLFMIAISSYSDIAPNLTSSPFIL